MLVSLLLLGLIGCGRQVEEKNKVKPEREVGVSGVKGIIYGTPIEGPTPERLPTADKSFKERPPPKYRAAVTVRAVDDFGNVIAETKSDRNGIFEMRLNPGSYQIEASYKFSRPLEARKAIIEIEEGRWTNLEITVRH